jgi:hypothetical protein
MKCLVIYAILLISILWVLFKPKARAKVSSGDGWNVYGTMGCGWTKKQLSHLKSKGVKHTFIDCTKQDCNGVDAFPTLVHSQSGEKIVGYTEKL